MGFPSFGAQSGSNQTTTTPMINPQQMAENNAASQVFGQYAQNAGNTLTGSQDQFNKSLPGVNQMAGNVASYGNQAQNILGGLGQQNSQVGSQGLQNLFSNDYEQQQLNASQIPAQQQYQQNVANQNAGFGGSGQLGSARAALAGGQLAQTNQQNQQMAAANVANQVAQQRASAANQLMTGGQNQIQGGLQAGQAGLGALQVPMQYTQLFSQLQNAIGQGTRGQYGGTSGSVTTQNTGQTSAGIGK